jgi:hypothetical protein
MFGRFWCSCHNCVRGAHQKMLSTRIQFHQHNHEPTHITEAIKHKTYLPCGAESCLHEMLHLGSCTADRWPSNGSGWIPQEACLLEEWRSQALLQLCLDLCAGFRSHLQHYCFYSSMSVISKPVPYSRERHSGVNDVTIPLGHLLLNAQTVPMQCWNKY